MKIHSFFSPLFYIGVLSMHIPSVLAANLVVHEWGTFTSVQDSKGNLLDGIYHEDEPLPDFVYGRDQFSKNNHNSKSLMACEGARCKRFEPTTQGTLLAANEKLETPVIYFYSKEPLSATVEVNFPKGIISQWFPNASSYQPSVDQIQSLSGGKMSWKVDVLSNKDPSLPPVSEQSIWAPSREVKANPIQVGSEFEKFIFYRGLGTFNVPVKIQSSQSEISLANQGRESIASAFVLEYTGESGSFISMGQIPGNQSRALKFSDIKDRRQPVESYLGQVSKSLVEALVQSGLYRDEALAMVHTWSKSYFKTKGIRVLYILPRKWTDDLLPIQIQPSPSELVRTLVGRVEALTLQEEKEIESRLKTNPSPSDWERELGRFAEPKLRHVKESKQLPQTGTNSLSRANTTAVE